MPHAHTMKAIKCAWQASHGRVVEYVWSHGPSLRFASIQMRCHCAISNRHGPSSLRHVRKRGYKAKISMNSLGPHSWTSCGKYVHADMHVWRRHGKCVASILCIVCPDSDLPSEQCLPKSTLPFACKHCASVGELMCLFESRMTTHSFQHRHVLLQGTRILGLPS